MNLAQLRKAKSQRVQLVPAACEIDEFGRSLPETNDVWLIDQVTESDVHISNLRTRHHTRLGHDHIHHFTSNPDAARIEGGPHGFFTLLVQIFIQGVHLWIKPTLRPGEPVPAPEPRISERLVDFRFPTDSGLQDRLEAQGYQVAWCSETKLARRLDLEGWELVIVPDGSDGFTTYRIRDRPTDQILIKRRPQRAP
ncbi:MAG: hypothetical protein JJT93_15490 [Gammaproteobacteria bacterium]|nr:hypothetical protein [Gammaproteobacteria bacterium]